MSDHEEEGTQDDSITQNVTTLKSMGIEDEDHIKQVLRQTSNDLEAACSILFPDDGSHESFEQIPGCDREMETQETQISQTDSDRDSTTVSYSLEEDRFKEFDESYPPESEEPPPPSYEESIIVDEHQELPPAREMDTSLTDDIVTQVNIASNDDQTPLEDSSQVQTNVNRNIEFPLTHYYELEGRVHTDQWSIPYKKEESLGVCMLSTIEMMREGGAGVVEADENCMKFLKRTLPCSFDKLLTHEAVSKWDESIMKGIREMCHILIEMISIRLNYRPIPVYLLDLLAMAFNAASSFHNHNRSRPSSHPYWVNHLGDDGVFAQSPSFSTRKDPKGWLVEYMNYFAFYNGITHIRNRILDKEYPPTLNELTALFNPFSACDEYIIPAYFKAEMSDCMLFAMKFVEGLADDSLKDKEVGCVFDLLKTLKTLFRRCGMLNYTNKVDTLRLTTTLRMFQIPHYNAKMNALKEVVHLTEEPYSAARAGVRSPIQSERVKEWLITNKVLSIAFGGNLHQAQYCDKVKSIVEFLGTSLSLDELSTIWDMQVDKNPAQVENIHNILAYAASRFSAQHMDHLFHLIQKSWEAASSDSYREKLLGLIGKIGKDDRTGKTAPKILELLWNLAHLPQLSRETVELALESHYSILIDSYHIRDQERRLYIGKCADDIKKGQWVVAAIRQLHRLAKGMFNSRHGHRDQQQIAELQKQYDLLRVTAATLSKVHSRNVQLCKEKGDKLTGSFVMDGRYTHEECVDANLQFMSFLLRDGALYLPTKRANELWDILISNEDACADDRRLAFKWFDNSMPDLEYDTQSQIFTKKVLKIDPAILDVHGYHCVRNFFENINITERKLRKLQHSQQLIVDNPDLTGLEYLWKAALEVPDKNIADDLIASILQISYNSLNQKLKKDPAGLHRKFIDECFSRLDSLYGQQEEEIDHESRSTCVERLLLLAQRYITIVEESHSYPRQIPPHGACYHGNPIKLTISVDQQQSSFSLECHTNETVMDVRRKIANSLGIIMENVQLGTSDKWLSLHHYNKLLHQLGITDGQIIIVKTLTQGIHGSNFESTGNSERLQTALKMERLLPSVLMSSKQDLYSKLESLCSTQEPRILLAVRNLLSLIPINAQVLEGLEIFVHPELGPGASGDPRPSSDTPKSVLDNFFSTKNVSPTELLYNLEVLSGKLMPSVTNGNDTTSQIFKKNFMEAGGLKYVIDIFQNSTFPLNTNILIIQNCYVMALSLTKFLLCAPPPIPTSPELSFGEKEASKIEEGIEAGELEEPPSLLRQMSKTKNIEDEVARLTIETMSLEDFTLMLTYLMEVCWATAAGQLDLVVSKDKKGEELQAGLCAKTDCISNKDVIISCESLELFVTCLKLRKNDITMFYKLPKVEEFIIDILLGSASTVLRMTLVDYMHELCEDISVLSVALNDSDDLTNRPHPPITEIPHYYFLHLLLSNSSSLWKHSSQDTNEITSWSRCNEYFEFLVNLLKELLESEQKLLKVDVKEMISTEISWLTNVTFEDHHSHSAQTLLTGHLKLLTALFSCYGIDKRACSEKLVLQLLNEYLFPSSIITHESSPALLPSGIINITAKCCSIPARVAAYELLIQLSIGCHENYRTISERLIKMHHQRRPDNPKEWEFRPLVEGRSKCGFVGLKNAGATCYMNSVLQQLYLQPGISEKILNIEKDEEDTTVLPEIQVIFGHLMESKLQYYTPDFFWKNFKLEGRHINVLEHQDASEFFSSLTDQMDEALKKRNYPKVFEGRFGGQFLDQIICHGCEHRFEKQQGFTTLQLSVVQSKSLIESLQEFVRGDMLEGDNRYLCGECDEKRDTLKRTCLKTLPPVLVIHLKRFDYDWETNREIKFNNYFEFPWFLDMEPYTADGITSREKDLGPAPKRMYELTGIIVHQGQASAGHYYAFIKDKKRVTQSLSHHHDVITTIPEEEEMEVTTQQQQQQQQSVPETLDRWLKFNDTLVEEFVFTDVLLETECFGGAIKTSSSDPLHNSHPETKVRHWNAYMLFYEAVCSPETTTVQNYDLLSPVPLSGDGTVEDKLSQLQELVNKGEKRRFFEDSMPSEIQRSVNAENLKFMQHRDVYCKQYFDFIRKLISCNDSIAFDTSVSDSSYYGQISIELAIQFLLHTYFKSYRDLRKQHSFWVAEMERILINCSTACKWFIEFMSGSLGEHYLKPFLLECSSKEVREDFCAILGHGLQSYCSENSIEDNGPVDKIISSILQMLDNDVIDNWKTCAQYFLLLKSYANHSPGCHHLLIKETFVKLIQFLLGPTAKTDSDTAPRRWSSVQAKEFGGIYGTISLLLRNSDFSIFESETVSGEAPPENPYMMPSTKADLLPPSEGMHEALFIINDANNRFIKECSLTLRDSDASTTDAITGIFCYCCWNNQTFSATVIGEIQTQIHSVPASELKSYFKVLMDILLIEDSLQEKRILVTLKGIKYKPEVSIFRTIRESNESKRIYQGIKFLVGLANKCKIGKTYILTQSDHLQSAVSWLKKKINEYSWTNTPSSGFSNESSISRIFQRSVSAQDTLEEANALLNELEARESKHSVKSTSNGHNNNLEG